MSVMERRPGLREWIAERVLDVAGTLDRSLTLGIDPTANPFLDERLRVENLPIEPRGVVVRNRHTGEDVERRIALFLEPGEKKGPRRGRQRDRRLAELRHRRAFHDDGGRPVLLDQRREGQPVRPLRPGRQPPAARG